MPVEPQILAVGLTPAWQQILSFDSFTLGEVNRARQVLWGASGKVLNAASALHCLNGPVKALTVVGGVTGHQVSEDCRQRGILARWIKVSGSTRVCTTIIDNSKPAITELVPEASPLTLAELDELTFAFKEESKTATVLVLIGSLPIGTPPSFYRDLLKAYSGIAILDVRGPELLEALVERPFLVKPNRKELSVTVGRDLSHNGDLFSVMREFNDRGVQCVLVTDGGNPAYASIEGHFFRFLFPRRQVINPIGCGDCMTAGIAHALFQGQEPLNAIRFGFAAAADKLGRLQPGEINSEMVHSLLSTIQVVSL